MLVLTRKSNQSIMIGDDIELTVLSIAGGTIRVGIQAPRDVPILRTEIYEKPTSTGRFRTSRDRQRAPTLDHDTQRRRVKPGLTLPSGRIAGGVRRRRPASSQHAGFDR